MYERVIFYYEKDTFIFQTIRDFGLKQIIKKTSKSNKKKSRGKNIGKRKQVKRFKKRIIRA